MVMMVMMIIVMMMMMIMMIMMMIDDDDDDDDFSTLESVVPQIQYDLHLIRDVMSVLISGFFFRCPQIKWLFLAIS